MKKYVDINQLPSDEQLVQWLSEVQNLKQSLQQFRISLSTEERRFRRKMGARRVAYVQVGERLGGQHEQRLSREFDIYLLSRIVQVHQMYSRLFSHFEEMYEMMDDTLMAIGIDAVSYTRIIHETLRIANQLDPSLDTALEELDEFHKRAQSEENEAAPPTEDVTAALE